MNRERSIREMAEEREYEVLSPYAAHAGDSKGREREEPQCDIRTVYQRDRDRILHSKSFRRLAHKTQVFIAPMGDHYRTRLTHTLEVSQLSRTIAKALRLNDDLSDAIALGHDLGHTPFGHTGERVLNEICPLGFAHFRQSIRVVEVLEKNGEGLNLTWEVRDGILNHRTSGHPSTLEGQIVRFCDKIAYINHDIDDAERAGILSEEDIPKKYREILGGSTRDRLNTLIHDVIYSSLDRADIRMSPEIEKAMMELRKFMFDHVYLNSVAKTEEGKVGRMITMLYQYYEKHVDEMPQEYIDLIKKKGQPEPRVVCDYISGMTDQYSISKFQELFVPQSWQKK
ncbi:deoxyguanosinetriphosphate triphosphohydrolase [Porcincola intestinalis]|nr:deoxyguanosinetriphosphate triphosphohydrolase [Porcincola intestinalis]MDY5579118.1 deoxyguanosinetriphosphate triphosphohydrolase [Porcincola intestinalis]